MNGLAKFSLLLVIILVSLSAYLRLAHSGIGCEGFPACYGLIGEPPSLSEPVTTENAYERLVQEADEPLSWATPLHRLVASVLGLCIVALCFLSLRQKRQRIVSFLLLALTVYLAVLGIRSGSLHDPAVVMGNLAGGFCMLGLLGWMVFSGATSPESHQPNATVRNAALVALFALCLQILLGGLTSANFAATSCMTLPDCNGGWLPDRSLMDAMRLNQSHEITSEGYVVGGPERMAIHKTHRLGALLVFLTALIGAIIAFRAGAPFRAVAIAIGVLLLAEFSAGIAAILTSLPIVLAVAHNWLAGLLLLALLKLLTLSR